MSGRGERPGIPPEALRRADESPDELFYAAPRFVQHIDDATIAALAEVYREKLRAGDRVLDLMSSWVSHLPPDLELSHVVGLGMNAEELAANPRLDEWLVHDLNREPKLPYADGSFDAVLNAVSVQYLTKPVEVFREVARVLRPGGLHLVAVSHRTFPTKAVAIWVSLPPRERVEVVRTYSLLAGRFDEPTLLDRSPEGADPLWVLASTRSR